MLRSTLVAAVAVLSFAVAMPSAQQVNPCVGVWTLDTSSPAVGTQTSATTMTITEAGNGLRVEVREQNASQPERTWSFQTGGDSQEMPVTGLTSIDSVTTTSKGDRHSTSVFRKAGKVVSESTAEVSADGRTLTITTRSVGPSGEPVSRSSTYRKTS